MIDWFKLAKELVNPMNEESAWLYEQTELEAILLERDYHGDRD